MFRYPAVLFICWIFGTINRIQNSVAPLAPVFILTCLHYVFGGLQGKEERAILIYIYLGASKVKKKELYFILHLLPN